MYCWPAMACCSSSTDAGIASFTGSRFLPAKRGSDTVTERGSPPNTVLVASGFSRKIHAGLGLPPKGGSHAVTERDAALARRAHDQISDARAAALASARFVNTGALAARDSAGAEISTLRSRRGAH